VPVFGAEATVITLVPVSTEEVAMVSVVLCEAEKEYRLWSPTLGS
jgi:hypothetical protein